MTKRAGRLDGGNDDATDRHEGEIHESPFLKGSPAGLKNPEERDKGASGD
jgi:hypothetical protein